MTDRVEKKHDFIRQRVDTGMDEMGEEWRLEMNKDVKFQMELRKQLLDLVDVMQSGNRMDHTLIAAFIMLLTCHFVSAMCVRMRRRGAGCTVALNGILHGVAIFLLYFPLDSFLTNESPYKWQWLSMADIVYGRPGTDMQRAVYLLSVTAPYFLTVFVLSMLHEVDELFEYDVLLSTLLDGLAEAGLIYIALPKFSSSLVSTGTQEKPDSI